MDAIEAPWADVSEGMLQQGSNVANSTLSQDPGWDSQPPIEIRIHTDLGRPIRNFKNLIKLAINNF